LDGFENLCNQDRCRGAPSLISQRKKKRVIALRRMLKIYLTRDILLTKGTGNRIFRKSCMIEEGGIKGASVHRKLLKVTNFS
jgi:hypothetical protein